MHKKTSSTILAAASPGEAAESALCATNSWEQFVSTGEFGDISPRQVICESWIRSRTIGLDPESTRAPTAITADVLEEKIKQGDLGRAASNVINELSNALAGTKHVVVLGDEKGRMLLSVGHEQVRDELEEINFRPGGLWSEQEVGPNGIGTPLALNRPEVIMGHEHYCKGWQPWVCYGAPIPGLYGDQPAGVIDITAPAGEVRTETMTLAISMAHSIHSGLSFLQLQRRETLRTVCRDRMIRWPNEGVLVLDENGYIIDFNSKASRLMNLKFPQMVENPVTHFLPDIWAVTHKSIQNNITEEMLMEMKSENGISQTVRVRVEPVLHRQQNLGALVVISGREVFDSSARKAVGESKSSQSTKYNFDNIRGRSPRLQSVIALAKAAARDPLQSNVLLVGETGVGKEMIAHSIHAESHRAEKPFIAINCGAMPRELIESELFGYVAGTFTGARRDGMKGKFEHAGGGTLFLDEIDSLDSDVQAKFLRVLDHNEITRIGSVKPIHVDVRIIAAGSNGLPTLIESGQFRQDLFHRLSVLEIDIPPLRDRADDVIDLAYEFIETECWEAGRSLLDFSEDVKDAMLTYDWPGNIRELQNLCKRWVLIVQGDTVEKEDLPEKMTSEKMRSRSALDHFENQNLRVVNDELIMAALKETGGNISKAARTLGIDRTTIYRRRKAWENNS